MKNYYLRQLLKGVKINEVLAINCGSSSLKYQLFNMEDESVLAKGLVERIGIEGSMLTHQPTGKDNCNEYRYPQSQCRY